MTSADEIIKKLNLKPLPMEGGFYTETYRSPEKIPKTVLPNRYSSDKPFGTAIYYLLIPDTRSALHRLPTDEIFHFYLGDPVIMLQLLQDGKSKKVTMGHDIEAGQRLQVIVPRGVWQGSILKEEGRFALLGTTMAPGFDSSDYEIGYRNDLIKRYPKHKDLIMRLTSWSAC
jgi:predicted cupin superfamily sugar epimerase